MKLPDDQKHPSATAVAVSSTAVPIRPKRKSRLRKVILLSVLVLITAPLAGRLLSMTIFLPLLPVTTFPLPLLMRGDIHGDPWITYFDPTVFPTTVLARLTLGGTIMPLGRLVGQQPHSITEGPDHHLWITTEDTIERVDGSF